MKGSVSGVRLAVALGTAVLTASLAGCSSSSIDNTSVGGTLSGDHLHGVLGHLFDGVNTVHVSYVPQGSAATATAAADVIIGPPVQASITLTTASTPVQTANVVIKDDKAYLHTASFGAKWLLMSSADDGVSGAPAFGQTAFELRYLGPTTVATYQGSESVDGISTRKYVLSATPSPSASASASPSPAPSAAPTVVATVWIDNSGRLIRYTYSPTGDGTWITATYSGWGEPVTVTAPPSKDVNVAQGTL